MLISILLITLFRVINIASSEKLISQSKNRNEPKQGKTNECHLNRSQIIYRLLTSDADFIPFSKRHVYTFLPSLQLNTDN